MQSTSTLTPFIIGSGRAGHALAESLAILNQLEPTLGLAPAVMLPRGANLADARRSSSRALLCIANPHGLHAQTLLEADRAGFDAIACEKPACVNLEQVQALRSMRTPTAVLHVYRAMWGMQTIRQMIEADELGEIFSLEGRYWQSSAAERALSPGGEPKGWKADVALTGEFDTYLDLATHFIDAISTLAGSLPSGLRAWRSFVNADAPHRDNHVQLTMNFANGARGFGSVSKTVHGATNHFEINVLGSRGSATWKFEQPDQIELGAGRDRRIVTRKSSDLGSRHPPHHGMGWLEGYIEILHRLLGEVYRGSKAPYPRLSDNLDLLERMLRVEWER